MAAHCGFLAFRCGSDRITGEHDMKIRLTIFALLLSFAALSANAGDGLYAGVSVGSVALDTDFGDITRDLDDDETGYSGVIGLKLSDSLAIEGGYNNFGSYSNLFDLDLTRTSIDADFTGFDLFGVLSIPLGPLEVFGKAGVVFWNAETDILVVPPVGNPIRLTGDEDGSDLAFGVGANVEITSSLSLRGEYEWFDLDNTERVSFVSLGLLYRF